MFNDIPTLTHEQQQKAVERIQALMAEGMSSGEAIAIVAAEVRRQHKGDVVTISSAPEEE